MYFEFNHWLFGLSLAKVSIIKGIIILLFNKDDSVKFVPWWKVSKERRK